MARRADLVGFIKGLEKIAKALVETQGGEVQQAWKNSSLRSATTEMKVKAEETLSDAVTKQADIQQSVQDKISLMATQAKTVLEMARSRSSQTSQTTYQGDEVNEYDLSKGTPEDLMFTGQSVGMMGNSFDDKTYTMSDKKEVKTEFKIATDPTPNMNSTTVDANNTGKLNPDLSKNSEGVNKSSIHTSNSNQDVNISISGPGKNSTGALKSSPIVNMSSTNISGNSTELFGGIPGVNSAAICQDVGDIPLLKNDQVLERDIPIQKTEPKMSSFLNSEPKLSERARERRVPASRVNRLASFGGLAAGLGIGAFSEVAKRGLGLKDRGATTGAILDKSPFLTEANAERIVNTLCRVRGAALKLGQMLSIQDNSLLNPEIAEIFDRVRQSADFMPTWQMMKKMKEELGNDWQSKLASFEELPFAAASIGQVHKGVLHDGREVAIKIQYPGVAKSIDSDINNIMSIISLWNILPKGMYVENVIRVAKHELSWEVDYIREAQCCREFRELLKNNDGFYVPEVIDELSTGQVLTTEFVRGLPLDACTHLDQDTRNMIGERLLYLTLTELFEWRFMQTDPNWSNFFYNPDNGKIILLDFGASRRFHKNFVDDYIRIIKAAADQNRKDVLEWSQKTGFLTGYETKEMETAHIDAVMILGQAFACNASFDFSTQSTASRIHGLIPVMAKQRLTPPPEETYSLHRKMAGAFLLCTKLGCKVNCRPMFDNIWDNYTFGQIETEL